MSGFAQKNSNSPYSYFGLGESGGLDHANFIAMGNTFAAGLDSTVINYYNPASYNLLAKEQPLFSFGISSRLSTYNEGDSSSFRNLTGLQHFALAFPVRKNFGLAFGLQPFTRKGYEITNGETVNGDSLVYKYEGSGGVNEVFIGFSGGYPITKSTKLSIGMNAGYVFGESQNTRKSGLFTSELNPLSGGIEERIVHLSAFHYSIGSYLTQSFGNHQLTASFVFEPSQRLNGDFNETLYYTNDIDEPTQYDTINYSTFGGFVNTAPSMNIGLCYKLLLESNEDNGRRLNSEFSFSGSYQATEWERYSSSFTDNSVPLSNTSRISGGIQFTPEIQIFEKSSIIKFHERIKYRAGFYNQSLPYSTNGEQVNEMAGTFGFGIHVLIQKSLSSINFGASIGTRGVTDSNALKENFYGINLGITLAPGSAERWFRKPKLN